MRAEVSGSTKNHLLFRACIVAALLCGFAATSKAVVVGTENFETKTVGTAVPGYNSGVADYANNTQLYTAGAGVGSSEAIEVTFDTLPYHGLLAFPFALPAVA